MGPGEREGLSGASDAQPGKQDAPIDRSGLFRFSAGCPCRHIRAELDRLLAERNGHAVLSGAHVLDSLRDLAERLQTPEDWAPGPALRALELLGKHLRLWEAPPPAVLTDDVRAFLDRLTAAVIDNVSSAEEVHRVIAAIEAARDSEP